MNPAALSGARRRVRRLLRSSVRIETPGAGSVWSEELETYVPGPPTVHYSGPASVRTAGSSGRVVDAAGQLVLVKGYEIALPGDVGTTFPSTARVVVTSCPGMPNLVGATLQIKESPLTDGGVERLLLCTLAA